MAVAVEPDLQTLQDLIDDLGGIPPARIWMRPPLGSAVEADAIAHNERKLGLCELVGGSLVEKGMGYVESLIAGAIFAMIRDFVRTHRLGVVSVADGPYRLAPGLVRIPDVAFAAWSRFPDGRLPKQPIVDAAPDLAVEVLSASNTREEMDRKRREYFAGGTLSVWLVDPDARTITRYNRGQDEPLVHRESDVIELTEILPGFRLSLAELFGELDESKSTPTPT